MKYKILSGILVISLLITAIFATINKPSNVHKRVHQHLTDLKEQSSQSGQYQTHLPIVMIDTNQQSIVDLHEDKTSTPTISTISIIDNQKRMNSLTDKASLTTKSEIDIRGNSSRHFDKKSYTLSFIDDNGKNNNLEVMGMPKDNKWVLNGPFLDKTLMRNYMMMNVSAEIMGYASRVKYCEVFLNRQYQGLYLMMEPISQGEDRVDISKSDYDDNPFTSYIIRADRGSDNSEHNLDNFSKYARRMPSNSDETTYYIDVIYPSPKNLTAEKKDYIEKDFSQFEKSLYSFDYDTKDYGYKTEIDVASFVDYFIINEFFQNYDATLFSTYFYKDTRGKIHIGPVWDFNNCMNNYVEQPIDIQQIAMQGRTWYYMLFKDEEFVQRVIDRYQELRKSYLNEDYLIQYINDTKEYLGSAINRNFDVWGYSFDYTKLNSFAQLLPKERNIMSYSQGIQQIEDYIVDRGHWLDKNIETLKQYCHESKNKKFNH